MGIIHLAGSRFDATRVPGMRFGFESHNVGYVAETNRLTQATDVSGNGNTLVQDNPTLRELYVPNVLNGWPAMRWDVNGGLYFSTPVAQQAIETIFCVIQLTSVSNTYQYWLADSGNFYSLLYNNNAPMINNSSAIWGSSTGAALTIIKTFVSGATTAAISVNNAVDVSGAFNAQRNSWVALGYNPSIPTRSLRGYVFCCYCWPRILTTPEELYLWRGLSRRYDISLAA
jgi:hypothetical protein